MSAHSAPSTPVSRTQALWEWAAIGLPTGLVLLLYWWSGAPGLTWAHAGADGGDLLTAAVVNGVPHPTGYPLYTLLLRGWLWLGQLLWPGVDFAYWGNRLSALCVAGATACTVAATAAILTPHARRWQWAALAGSAFALSELAWSQALITEVYGLHALLVAALGWAALRATTQPRRAAWLLGLLMGLAAAHHLTSLLLWPALLYWRLRDWPLHTWWRMAAWSVGAAVIVAALGYASMVWRVTTASAPLPVAWGDPRNLEGLWWLVSGVAYRAYVFGMTVPQYIGRLAALARIVVEQYTPIGLGVVIGGFALWDRHRPYLRNGALLWMLPISLYTAGYNTADSYVYLLPVAWLMALALGQGLASGSEWLMARVTRTPHLISAGVTALAVAGLVSLAAWRLPQVDLRHDQEAMLFLDAATNTLEPGSLVISSADAETFALWYGQWGSAWAGEGTLARAVPDLVLVNIALYHFGWYRDLLHELYPEVPMIGAPFDAFIAANQGVRPIYLSEALPVIPGAELTPVGKFWRLEPFAPE